MRSIYLGNSRGIDDEMNKLAAPSEHSTSHEPHVTVVWGKVAKPICIEIVHDKISVEVTEIFSSFTLRRCVIAASGVLQVQSVLSSGVKISRLYRNQDLMMEISSGFSG